MNNSQKDLLKLISQNQLDKVNIMTNLKKYKVIFNNDSTYVILKYKLKIKVLEQLLQYPSDDPNKKVEFERMKKETEDFLIFHNEKLSRVNFKYFSWMFV